MLSLLLFVKVDQDIQFGTQPQSYSWYYTDPLETVQIQTLINNPETFYTDVDYIEQLVISNETRVFAMELIQIEISENEVLVEEKEYYIITWEMRPKVIPTNTRVEIEDATMVIRYQNGDQVTLAIGTMDYVFMDDVRTELALTELSATHEMIGDIETVSALQLGLKNRTSGLVEIRSIHVMSQVVSTNTSQMVRDVDCRDIRFVSSCLGIQEYAFLIAPVPSNMHEIILPGQETTFYVPLTYQEVIPFHRFVIEVIYQVGQEEYMMYFDDFPFIRATPFSSNQRKDYTWYVVDSSS
jgi:hypothetical protein